MLNGFFFNRQLFKRIKDRCYFFKFKYMTPKAVFSFIYQNNSWGNKESVSGPGSTLSATKNIRKNLPELFEKYNIKSVLDLPCGDFNWMNHMTLDGIEYLGADIITDLIENNKKKYETSSRRFKCINLLEGGLPEVDLIFVRDCLVHLSYKDIIMALNSIVNSNSKYLITTTYYKEYSNTDIITGDWRKINLQKPPFNFPNPQMLIREFPPAPESNDKSLGLWRIKDIKNSISEWK